MISPEKQFFIAIWRMTTPDSYRSICEKFDVSRSTALLATRRVTKILADLAPVLIKWPTGNAIQEVWTGFEVISSFPKVIGAINDTHINIPSPHIHPEAYVNRKGHHSIQLQGICDHKARFTHGYIGHAGSVHDQHVFRQSEIQDALGNPEKFPDDSHLLDAAYKIHDNLMVPYRDNGHLTERQKNYNFCHSSTRIAIERAFGTLKGRFRSLLHNLSMNRTDLIAHYILACCVMHNICILRNDDFDIVLLNNEVDNDIPRQVAADDTTGVLKRELAIDFQ
ncbi:putative nuclease HARBI1 isoform X1 [Harpegnathos saltator]|uniref:putative nuclease HARBI1 isoform X1 n=1 Tax=Harpegnathos saltator TaxID=610380 RepID=UPI000DBEE9C8|nr:putative nuclease HARBI1 isoform X1 [Harpegnathos saltator]